ncbi:MAG: hypothetical protein R3C10_06570 [Pirellulales bacterium]
MRCTAGALTIVAWATGDVTAADEHVADLTTGDEATDDAVADGADAGAVSAGAAGERVSLGADSMGGNRRTPLGSGDVSPETAAWAHGPGRHSAQVTSASLVPATKPTSTTATAPANVIGIQP